MKKFIALGAIVLGGAVALQVLARQPQRRFTSAVRQRVFKRMERMMAALPEGAPPKLIMSVLPRLREQNEEIVRLLREQNELLRERAARGEATFDAGRSVPRSVS